MNQYDCAIIGGGPAGLSAAIYLGRYLRKTIVIDSGEGRWNTREINENYLGFPQGIHTTKLRELGIEQAKKFGAVFTTDDIEDIQKDESGFSIFGKTNNYQSKTIILATGVIDQFPELQNIHDYIGKSVFWCITCDGHKVVDKKVVCVGNSNDAACTTLQMLQYTKNISFVVNAKSIHISKRWLNLLKMHNISLYHQEIKSISGKNGKLSEVILSKTALSADFLFSLRDPIPDNLLAKCLGVQLNSKGYIKVNSEQRTNIPFIYAAGDITNLFSQQIAAAVHQGAMAAESANYDLYASFQQE